ncbi:alpha-beta hydrolase superfamily lysophospholipase/SAM-dependent methyltransferase [Rhodoferax ferrireducens]|uniref:Alpha-beta hydrolase superfamily lysophospholipase/SAM-dependent methyltransferase n=1 Tax=Rhodoferax ferrireducens TaxID=192843 RepID=A0ABU2C3I2_9BURK|nr:bifunctional alpha/beta hydrolase/class I SAM-dependent methyltransferase [Rhodoferax ferrireducens]MDR7375885.1 alpha-beta hydrolase superfamily lysophospholipase/SAM-dependent methyltransferase [Rhodoferax ferrireducens]
MTPSLPTAWTTQESGFDSFDRTRLFYRSWQPVQPRVDGPPRALVFLHRGHEHSGRIQPLVEQLGFTQDWAFAWDARGHGHSPGERGDAPSFYALVQDFEAFVRHLQATHGIAAEDIFIVANSVGAVIAATWLHDFAPRVRGVVMAAAAFDINLYVPLAKPALRLALRFKPGLRVTSYIRSRMLTHSAGQALLYDSDALITRNISARVLIDLADTAQRVVDDAHAIDTPVLMLAADKDYVVKQAPQRRFFDGLASRFKRFVLIPDCHHAIFYEDEPQAQQALQASQAFIEECFAQPLPPLSDYHLAHTHSPSAHRYQALQQDMVGSAWEKAFFGLQKAMLDRLGHLSNGMQIGLSQGFDSGASLDYVYRNQAGGRLGVGAVIDQGYLDAIGWRGIRQRKVQLQGLLGELIAQYPADQPLRILDIAAGSGRYVLETAKRFQDRPLEITLREINPRNLEQAQELSMELQLKNHIAFQRRDAFDPDSYPEDEAPYDIVIVSGLYELFSDNQRVLQSLQGIAQQLKVGGHLVYTGQPWHPQLLMIAKTLNNHLGRAWQMRPRPQAEMDALVASVGCRKLRSEVGIAGIFTVSVAQREAAAQPASGSAASSPAATTPG